jgi:hypothetical protein
VFFGALSFDRSTELVPLGGDPLAKRGSVTSRIILKCLQERLPEIVEDGITFMHDNGPTFKARLCKIG